MVNLLKSFGKGILYIIGLPFFILFLLLYAIYGIFLFFFMIIKAIVLFFTGRSLFEDLPEDRKAKEILHPSPKNQEVPPVEEAKPVQEEPQKQQEPTPEVTPQYIPPIYPSVFTPEYVPLDENKEEPSIETEPEEEVEYEETPQDNIETKEDDGFLPNFMNKDEEKEEPMPIGSTTNKEEEIIGRYTPKTSVFDDFVDDEEDNSSGGVRIERSDK